RTLIPSIVVAATAPDGTDTLDVTLLIDGKQIATRLPSTSLNLDPGEHVIRLEHAGWASVEQRVVLREREKDRRVMLRFAPPLTAGPRPQPRHTTSAFGIVMIAVGAAATATAVTFGVLGKVREDELAGSPCGKNGTCSHDDVDVVRQRYWTAGI